MAVSPNTDQAFLREVDEELRRDQLAGFWDRWGRTLIVAIVVGLVAFGGYLYWQHRQTLAAGEQGEKLQAAYEALGSGQAAKAQPQLTELAQADRKGYRALALFAQGDELLRANDLRGAAAKFAAVAGDADQPQPFRDLALVRQTAIEYDQLQPQVVIDRLRPLAVPGSAFLGSAGEMVAIAHLRAGRRDLAKRLLDQIAQSQDVPDTIRQRVVQMAGSMSGPVTGQGSVR